ncbi:MAG: DUF2325 domain-containing protein [Limosilactobacillus sp.]
MKIYDYRQELISLLENTGADQHSLQQTLRSLSTVVNILNHYGDPAVSTSPHHDEKKPAHRRYQARNRNEQPISATARHTLHSLLTGPSGQPKESATPQKAPTPHVAAEPEASQEISAEERLAADNLYLVHRKLSGAEINHRYYSEAILHQLHFPVEDGDVVELDPHQLVRGLPSIRRVTSDHLDDYTPVKINVIEYAELRPVPGSDVLQIASTMKGDSILDQAPANTVVVDPFKYPGRDLKAGMVIDFAYFDHGNGLKDASAGSIRWIHEKQDYDTTRQPAKPKTVKKVSNTKHDYEKKLDYDLKQRTVLVITGVRDKVQGLKPVIAKHHGVFHGLDASAEEKVSSSKIKREIRDADFVIVCIDAIHHRISQLANHHAKRYDKPLAIANVTSNTAVERAVARALNGDPAYAASSAQISQN